MITTSTRQKKTLRKLETELNKVRATLQALEANKGAYITAILEGDDADPSAKYQPTNDFNFELIKED